ncbi:N-acetylglucosaminyldiphosphodolichol N-acetylglucosaminyltransferase catalytic subunit alg13 [Microbotryomycetes sp. JL201]|nr:N-acetylglucosaminyldiphosphodolichol N-acetylglucosaminyltransferase catalytic subunit alg13 [Microbotryomycetes sp. JL201]
MKAVLTVGSTEFSPLVHALLSPDCLRLLHTLDVTSLLAQVGNSDLPAGFTINKETRRALDVDGATLHVTVVDFTDDIEQHIAQAQLVISHAGAGSILSAIRPSSFSNSEDDVGTCTQKVLVIVPNSSLMDSHQSDLADEFERHKWAIVVRDPLDLGMALKQFAEKQTAVSQEQVSRIPPFDGSKINRILDDTLNLS